jgi:hypothetical protein
MSQTVIVIGAIGLSLLLACSIIGVILIVFRRHDPKRAAASVEVAANVAFEIQLPGSPGQVFFRFNIDGDTELSYDLLVTGDIADERGGTRAFSVKTSKQSRIPGADSARPCGTTYAVSNTAGSLSLATVHAGDRAVRGVVREYPKGLLRKGWVYVPRGR